MVVEAMEAETEGVRRDDLLAMGFKLDGGLRVLELVRERTCSGDDDDDNDGVGEDVDGMFGEDIGL